MNPDFRTTKGTKSREMKKPDSLPFVRFADFVVSPSSSAL
jgi:hypothetical protein